MGARSGKPITADEATVVTESFLDSIMVENSKGDRRLPDPCGTNESDGFVVFSESDDIFNQLIAAETNPWRRRR